MTDSTATIAQSIVDHWYNVEKRLKDEIARHEFHGRVGVADRLRCEVERLRECSDEVKQRFKLNDK